MTVCACQVSTVESCTSNWSHANLYSAVVIHPYGFYRGGLVAEDQDQNKSGVMHAKKTLENWEEQLLQQQPPNGSNIVDHVKQENSAANGAYNMYGHENAEFHAAKTTWSQMMPVSSPTSCVTTLSSNMLDFSSSKSDGRHPPPDRSSEVPKRRSICVCVYIYMFFNFAN